MDAVLYVLLDQRLNEAGKELYGCAIHLLSEEGILMRAPGVEDLVASDSAASNVQWKYIPVPLKKVSVKY